MMPYVAILAGILAAGGQGQTAPAVPKALAPIDEAKVARSIGGHLVQVEIAVAALASEKVVLRSTGVVIGPRSVMVLAPRLPKVLSSQGASARIALADGEKGSRRVPARLVRTDVQTGLSVLQAEDLQAQVLNFGPGRIPRKNEPVVLVEPDKDGGLKLRRGELLQSRALLDQGNGKNPLLVIKILEPHGAETRYTHWEDDLASGAGTYLADLHGGFLGFVTPPALSSGEIRSAGGESSKPNLKEGEVLALPAEIVRFITDSLTQGKAPVRGYLGASFREVADPPEDVRQLGSAKPAVRVEKVYPGGPADQGGLQAGDWLVVISEKRKVSYAEVIRFSELVEYGGQGKTVRLVVARGIAGRHQLVQLKIQIGWR